MKLRNSGVKGTLSRFIDAFVELTM